VEAAFGANAQLQTLIAERDRNQTLIEAAEKEIAEARKAKLEPEPPFRDFLRSTFAETEAHQQWAQRNAAADEVLNKYYQYGNESTPAQAYKDLQALKVLITKSNAQIAQVQGSIQKEVEKQGRQAPTIVNLPAPGGLPGETQPSVWDPDKQTYVPATGPDGKPVPTNKPNPASLPAPRIDEGTQSWDLKQMEDGSWWQVPTIARKDGSFALDTASGRMPQRAAGFPGPDKKVEVYDGIPYTRDGEKLTPVAGYVKPPLFRTDSTGKGYTSTDDGRTWRPATGLPGTPQTVTVDGTVYPLDEHGLPIVGQGVRLPEGTKSDTIDGYFVQVDPASGKVTRTDLYTPEQRARFEETQGISTDTARTNLLTAQAQLARAQQLQDPTAEYQRQVQLSQQKATKYRDDLNDRIMRGELSVEDANTQFDSWWDSNVEGPLAPYQTMAEAAYRKEQNEYAQQQAAEQARVDALNRQREQIGFTAEQSARSELNALAPQARSPEFLAQLAQNVSRIGQPLPGGPSQHHGGMQFSPESLSLENVRRAMPNLTEVGQNAAARALASISPAAAQQIGAPPPKPPGLPEFQNFMNRAPFRLPDPTRPLAGSEALDLGNPAIAGRLGLPVAPGQALTIYEGGRREPWAIPQAG